MGSGEGQVSGVLASFQTCREALGATNATGARAGASGRSLSPIIRAGVREKEEEPHVVAVGYGMSPHPTSSSNLG